MISRSFQEMWWKREDKEGNEGREKRKKGATKGQKANGRERKNELEPQN